MKFELALQLGFFSLQETSNTMNISENDKCYPNADVVVIIIGFAKQHRSFSFGEGDGG